MSFPFLTIRSCSNELTLAEVITRLGQHTAVEGVLLIGSTGQEALTPASDYDLIVILSSMPAPLHVALTYIDGRLTDVIFMTVAAIERILSSEGLQDDADSLDSKFIRWLQRGQIAFDRAGRVEQAQAKVRAGQWLRLASDAELYAGWFSINYNVRQTRRMMASSDPIYQMAVDYRFLYTLAELWGYYFRVRRLPWEGEKGAARYLAAHDPAYLELFRRCLTEPDRARKMALYEQLADLTLAPVGGLWPEGDTALQFDLPAGSQLDAATVSSALTFWEELLGLADSPSR